MDFKGFVKHFEFSLIFTSLAQISHNVPIVTMFCQPEGATPSGISFRKGVSG
jgi:hypothetical protein